MAALLVTGQGQADLKLFKEKGIILYDRLFTYVYLFVYFVILITEIIFQKK